MIVVRYNDVYRTLAGISSWNKKNLLEKKQFTFVCKKILVTLYKQKAACNKLCYTDKKKNQYLSIAIQN